MVITRGSVQYVITEFGIANLHGLTIRERALALISIAHPKFRDKLLAEAKQLKFLYEDQILETGMELAYPNLETWQTFKDDVRVFFRSIRPTVMNVLYRNFLIPCPKKTSITDFFPT